MNIWPIILTTHKNKDRQQSILNTWGKEIVHLFYTDQSTFLGNQYVVSNNDTYYSGAEKQINILKVIRDYITDNYWILFCDDDTVPNLKLMESILPSLDKSKVYGRAINHFTPIPDLVYPSGGAGFLIHMTRIYNTKIDESILHKTWYSDVAFGLWMRDNDIEIINDDRFNMDLPEKLDPNALTYHYVKTHEDRVRVTNLFK